MGLMHLSLVRSDILCGLNDEFLRLELLDSRRGLGLWCTNGCPTGRGPYVP